MKMNLRRRLVRDGLISVVCPGAFMLLAVAATAQDQALVTGYQGTDELFEYSADGSSLNPLLDLQTSGGVGPVSMASDSSGNLFFSIPATSGNLTGNISEYSASHTYTTFANGPTYYSPGGLAFGPTGTLYASDLESQAIYAYATGGVPSTFASGLDEPDVLAVNGLGDVFEGDGDMNEIIKYLPNGTSSVFATGMYFLNDLVFDSNGNLFESDYNGGNIYEFAPDGTRSTFAAGLSDPHGLVFNDAGDLFVGTLNGIDEYTPGGAKSVFSTIGSGGALAFVPAVGAPEPSTWALLGLGAGALAGLRRRRLNR